MTDREQQKPQLPRRYPNANRAREAHNRIYQHLGVRDLREIIDRKRSERGHPNETDTAPPEPSYNYLKDPLRENNEHNPQELFKHSNPQRHKNYPSHNYKKEKEHRRGQAPPQDIENPVNIKVEFSISTGEHSYKLDQSTVLPTIKHVPDHTRGANRPFRGRGRGRGRGPRSYHTRTIRNRRPYNEFTETAQTPIQIPVDTEENWDNEVHAANVVHEEGAFCEHECSDSKSAKVEDKCECLPQDEGDHYGDIGLAKDVENLKITESEKLAPKNEDDERQTSQNETEIIKNI